MKITVIGATGMLGVDLCSQLQKDHEVVGISRRIRENSSLNIKIINVDIINKIGILETILFIKPDLVIHTAAQTDVDACELDPDQAYQVNALGTQNVALACKSARCAMVYISTDYVFDGKKNAPYAENDRTNPINIYGSTKLQGEEFTKSILKNYIIIRTSWLYGKNGKNFVDWVIDKAKKGQEINLINDQFGSPTYTADLAEGVSKLIEKLFPQPTTLNSQLCGVYHITNSGYCSRYQQGLKILEYAKMPNARVKSVSSDEFLRPAKRPGFSALENKRYKELFGQVLRSWDQALKDYLISRERL